MQPTPPPKVNGLPRDEVAASRRIASREDPMPTDGPNEPHTLPPVEPKYEFDVAATPFRAARAAARASRLAELGGDGSTLCASPWCANPHSENGRYCSKACSDDVARARYNARKGKAP